jgi:hypothetical protein
VPDGSDVAGRLEPLVTASAMLAAVYCSLLPVALSRGLTTPERSERWRDELAADAAAHRDRQVLWPLLIGCWKHKPPTVDRERER